MTVVPPPHAHNPPVRVDLGHVEDRARERLKVLDFKSEAPHGVFGVGVETRADEDQFRADLRGGCLQGRAEGGEVIGPRCAELHRDVPDEAEALARARLVLRA